MKTTLAGVRSVIVVILQSALLLLAMVLAFAPFSMATGTWRFPYVYLPYLFYPLLLYLLLTLSHKWFNHLPIASLGFSWRRLPSHFALGFSTGLFSVLGVVLLTAIWQPRVSLELSGQWGSPNVLLIMLADVWETSFMEEFQMRCYLLPALVSRRIGPHTAVLLSTLVFALAHFQMRPLLWLLPIAATGLLLGYLYYATASIWVPVGYHFAGNLLLGLINRDILLRASGMSENLASLAVTECALYLALTALVIWWHRRRLRTGASDFPTPRLTSDIRPA